MPHDLLIVNPPAPLNLTAPEALPASEADAGSVVELTRGLAAGREEAFGEFHRRYFNRLFRHVLALTRGEQSEAEEALQETLCRVARYARRFEREEVFWCWLTMLARSAVRDRGRKRRRYWTLLQNYALRWLPVNPLAQDTPDLLLDDALQQCLAALPPEDRAPVEAKYLQNLSVRALALHLGATEKAVESRLGRLRRQLREELLRKLHQETR